MNKVALVTGGASGIGAATVELLRKQGATVVAADVNVAEGIEPLDVTDETAVDALIARVVDEHGRLDLAANCAGVAQPDVHLVSTPTDVWRRVLAVNLEGLFLCLRAELRAMLANGSGSIVNVASAAGVRGVPRFGAYAASKHGVIGLTKTAALETVRKGVRVNVVCPGTTDTPMLRSNPDGRWENAAARDPMGRLAEPNEIAEAIVWLLSDRASFVSGATLEADGGVAAI
ncbi:MAG: SDR family NAD(P)-dependent oxidoreductase [Acidimicrobiales bacterium]